MLFNKYKIEKTDGSPVDPKAEYFVLRIDTDPAARKALAAYALEVSKDNPEFAEQLWKLVGQHEALEHEKSSSQPNLDNED